jgi:hypothetical protein
MSRKLAAVIVFVAIGFAYMLWTHFVGGFNLADMNHLLPFTVLYWIISAILAVPVGIMLGISERVKDELGW